ncbi:MAG TPA: Mur ligase family protein, partial [Lacibacter sp.]|nr:Mur ligase family protein [Lacibacter sp.]
MALLQEILYKTSIRSVRGSTAVAIAAVETDSRNCTPGCCFVAVKGVVTDGHAYIAKAVALGAVAIVCEVLPEEIQEGVTYVEVADSAEAAGRMAHSFFGSVSQQLKVVGVTGTNGKTTIATLLYKLFSELGYTCGLISTVQYHIGDQIEPASHTTPDAIRLNRLLRKMFDAGCTHVFMECSSHAIHQQRIAGIHFTGALFSNITHDHLDYHKTFDAYIRAKKAFFDHLTPGAFAISNRDDKRGEVMLQNCPARKYYYSLRSMADFKGKILE